MSTTTTTMSPSMPWGQITQQDLQGNPYKLNMALQQLFNLTSQGQAFSGPVQFGTGAITFKGTVTFSQSVSASGAVSLTATVSMSALPVYANNAAAKAAKLTAGTVYRTSSGQVMVVY